MASSKHSNEDDTTRNSETYDALAFHDKQRPNLRKQANFLSSVSSVAESPSSITDCAFIGVHSRLYLSLFEKDQVEKIAQHKLHSNYLVLPLTRKHTVLSENDAKYVLSSLEEIYQFDQMVHAIMRQNSGMKVVFYTGVGNQHQLKAIFLIGCHLIMTHGWTSAEVVSTFSSMSESVLNSENDCSVRSSWRAIFWAKKKNWINFKETFDLGLEGHDGIQMDEYLHYSRCTMSLRKLHNGTIPHIYATV